MMNTAAMLGVSTPRDCQNSAATGSIEAAMRAVNRVFQGALGMIGGNRRMMTAIQDTPAGLPTA
jgi:hypothetical protein